MAVTSLLGTTTCRVTLDNEELAVCCISIRAVGQFARQSASGHGRLALHVFARLAGCNACCSGQYHLVYDDLCLVGMFLQVITERFAYGLLYGTCNFTVAQLCLGLALKLRFLYLHADNCGKTLAEVLA